MSISQDHGKVDCPICGKKVNASLINAHLDSNCQMMQGTASHFESEGMSAATTESRPKRMAPLFTRAPTTLQTQPAQAPMSDNSASVNASPSPTTTAKRTSVSHPAQSDSGKRPKRSAAQDAMPLAAKVRPTLLSDFIGQEELLGTNGVLRTLIESDRVPSMILWGPPGCGKTTIARIISKMTKSRFIEMSATSNGAADVKRAFDEAKGHLALTGQRTIVFMDEIHRFTKAQQDLFLPYVEAGTIQLIGATTENPSFKVNSALLSRCRVFVMKQLTQDQITNILQRALQQWREDDKQYQQDNDMQLDTAQQSSEENDALTLLAVFSDGDARSALNTLEIAMRTLPSIHSHLEPDNVKSAFQKSHLHYDRNGEEHYNIISALHKSIRGSDANAALYWLGRMLEAGEDPLYVARRLVRCASEDVGLADNHALPLAMSAFTACEKIGMPDCDTILAHLVVYLAETKKSVRTYKAYNRVKDVIRSQPNHPVPLHIRNAPTRLMKDLGYGAGYKYNPDYKDPVDQSYLPEALLQTKFLDVDDPSSHEM